MGSPVRTRPPRLPLGRAHHLATTLARLLRDQAPVDAVHIVGDARRFEPVTRAVELLVVSRPEALPDLAGSISAFPGTRHSRIVTERRLDLHTDQGDVLIHVCAEHALGAALVWHTGSRDHLAYLQRRAQDRDLLFGQAQLLGSDGRPMTCKFEASLYAQLELPFIPPELRGAPADLDAHISRGLPRLVEAADMRGDLHTHTTWSDGRDELTAMVDRAIELGYAYIAVTDHSARALCSRTLSRDDVVRQRHAVADLAAHRPGIQILHGVEVEIMPDGTLDFDDELLASFDIVLASLHDDAGHSPARLLDRYLAAVAHPLVNVITHPANRTPGHAHGYDLDFEVLMRAARESGTAMEIDGAPGHLDMDGALARQAVEVGVTLVIDSDAHRTDGLARQMAFGVGTARRGGVEPRHVLNTRSIEHVRAFVAAKRARGGRSNLLP